MAPKAAWVGPISPLWSVASLAKIVLDRPKEELPALPQAN